MSEGKQEARCGERAEPIIPRRGMYRACVLPKGHGGEHRGGGNCFTHGPYIGNNCPYCPESTLDAILLKHGVRGRFQRERIISELSDARQPQRKAREWFALANRPDTQQLIRQIKALPSIPDEHGDALIPRGPVLAMLESERTAE